MHKGRGASPMDLMSLQYKKGEEAKPCYRKDTIRTDAGRNNGTEGQIKMCEMLLLRGSTISSPKTVTEESQDQISGTLGFNL